MAELTTAYIGLGSNLGNRERSIREALRMLADNGSVQVARVSDLTETDPLGPVSQPKYINGVAQVRTALSPQELLGRLKVIEAALGRPAEHGTWEPRTVDLDLLLFGDQTVQSAGLIVPHPQMHLRSFVLDGLCQLQPDLVHPVLREPVCDLAKRLGGRDFAPDPAVPQLVSVAGVIGVGKTTAARTLAEAFGTEVLYEPYDTNPFLPQVYAGRCELALDSQLYFLVHRAQQLSPEALTPGKAAVTDYVFDKEWIYARRLLTPAQLALYESIYRPFAERVARPVVVVYLHDAPRNCLERIHRRSRPYEQKMSLDFLEGLDEDYRRLFKQWMTCPVIRVPASSLTGYSEAVVEHLVRQVRAYMALGAQ
jgi:deoxyguanosine kinase